MTSSVDLKPALPLVPEAHRSSDLLLGPAPPHTIAPVPHSSELDRRGMDHDMLRYQSLTDLRYNDSRLNDSHLVSSSESRSSIYPPSPSSFSYPPATSNLTLLEQNRTTTNYSQLMSPLFSSPNSTLTGTPPYLGGGSPPGSLTSPFLYQHLYGSSPLPPQYNAGIYIQPAVGDSRERPDDRIRGSPTELREQENKSMESLGDRGVPPMLPTLTPAPRLALIPVPTTVNQAPVQQEDPGSVWRPY